MCYNDGVLAAILFLRAPMKKTLLAICFAWLLPMAFVSAQLPPAPPKVVRYAEIMIQRYDRNGDGVLQREEWERMPGMPQAIDLDGDGLITRDELIWFLTHYGHYRSIHRTRMIDLREPRRFDPENLIHVRPVWQRPTAPLAVREETGQDEDSTEAIMMAHDQIVDDEFYQRMLEERQIPAARPYHVLPERLQGVPAWFIMLDRNGDGQVSLKEFVPTLNSRMMALFERIDLNNDGFICPDEARASLAR